MDFTSVVQANVTPRRRLRTRPNGFSLAEVLVALFVIVVGIAGITSTIWWATKRSDSGKVVTEASNHARSIYETILSKELIGKAGLADASDTARTAMRAVPFDQPSLDYIFGEQAIGQAVNNDEISSDINRFTRNITVTNRPTGGYDEKLSNLRVRVYWTEGRHERNVSLEGVVARNG
jgi:prepilin-type N-terminal cleavage/methylation domain-containing protein